MSDQPNVTNVVTTKTSNLTRITWFLAGVIVSAVLLYSVPSSGDLATNVVGTVVERAPGMASTVGDTVGGWIDGLSAGEATQ